MIAVCGIGNPKGRRNNATTAYQSASPPMVAASANAATKPKIGCNGSSAFAVTNSVNVPASTSVASALTRRSVLHDAPQSRDLQRFDGPRDQQRTTPQGRRAAQHPGNARTFIKKKAR